MPAEHVRASLADLEKNRQMKLWHRFSVLHVELLSPTIQGRSEGGGML
jgi:hypothetical protein